MPRKKKEQLIVIHVDYLTELTVENITDDILSYYGLDYDVIEEKGEVEAINKVINRKSLEDGE